MEVTVVFFLVADEESANGEGLEFERGDAGIFRKRGRSGLGCEPGDRRGTRVEIDTGRVGVGESFDGPAFGAAMDAAAEAADRQASARAKTVKIDAKDEKDDDEGDETVSLTRIHSFESPYGFARLASIV